MIPVDTCIHSPLAGEQAVISPRYAPFVNRRRILPPDRPPILTPPFGRFLPTRAGAASRSGAADGFGVGISLGYAIVGMVGAKDVSSTQQAERR